MKRSLSLIAVTSLASFGLSAPAWAGAVTGTGFSDGFNTATQGKNTWLLDARANAVMLGGTTQYTLPTVSLTFGVTDTLEVGLGTTGYNLVTSGTGATATTTTGSQLFPWLRAKVVDTSAFKAGLMVGSLIPVLDSTKQYEFQPGITGIADLPMGPVTGTLNVGYSRFIKGLSNQLSGNIAFSGPLGPMTWYEEQFINAPLGGASTGGIRASLQIPVNSAFSFDIDPAYLYGANGPYWQFNPQVGIDLTF